MSKERKKFRRGVLIDLINRSGRKCECCGLDIIVDKHHIIEFSQGGPDEAANLLCVCPSCHRILPDILTQDDQRYIQKLNFEKRSSTFPFFSGASEFEIGSVKYKGVDCLLSINNKRIIYPYTINGRFYANIIMLEGFHPYLLIIANRVICGSDGIIINSTSRSITVLKDDKRLIEIEKTLEKIKIYISFKFKGYEFDLTEKGHFLPGQGYMHNVSFIDAPGAVQFNGL